MKKKLKRITNTTASSVCRWIVSMHISFIGTCCNRIQLEGNFLSNIREQDFFRDKKDSHNMLEEDGRSDPSEFLLRTRTQCQESQVDIYRCKKKVVL